MFIDGIGRGMFVGILIAAFYAAGYGAMESYGSWYEHYTRTEDWNKRGYIKCINGILNIGNIDFEGDIKNPIECEK